MFDDMFSVMPIARFGPGLKTRDALVEILCDIVRDNLQKNRALIERLRGYGEDELVRQVTKEIRSGVDNINVLLITITSSTLSTDPRSKPDEEEVMNVAVSMCLLWLAGNATSAAASQSITYELGKRPDHVAQLVAEQEALIAAEGGSRELTFEQTIKMPLLHSYITEICRTRPPVSRNFRLAARDMEIGGYYVPKNTYISCDFFNAHMDENIYPRASEIIIDRFLDRKNARPILSFGPPGSPHYCLGGTLAYTVIKTTFATLLRNYEFKTDPTQSTNLQYYPEVLPKSGTIIESFWKRGDI